MVQPEMRGKHGRVVAVALVVIFAVSACSAIAAEPLAVVPPTPVPEREAAPAPATAQPRSESQRPSKTAKPTPSVTVVKYKPRPKAGPFSINLYRNGDFMHQQTKNWCVAGSTQTMMNIIDSGKPNRSAKFQKKLYFEGRQLSHNQKKLGDIGMDLTGWMELLNTRGYGPYVVEGANTRWGAIKRAAKALRKTGKPVGLVTWRGAHSWVMSGFTATADPALGNDFEVKKVFIQDTWYPYVSSIWGASRPPTAAVPVSALGEDYLPYRRPAHRYPVRDGKFMLILPTLPADTVVR
jgi:hypothetical protein